jgi:hypothetical protein
MVQPDEFFLVAFFEEPEARTFALQAVTAAPELEHPAHAREGIGHDGAARRPLTSASTLTPPPCFLRDFDLARHRDGIVKDDP